MYKNTNYKLESNAIYNLQPQNLTITVNLDLVQHISCQDLFANFILHVTKKLFLNIIFQIFATFSNYRTKIWHYLGSNQLVNWK